MSDVVSIILAQATENLKKNITNTTGKRPSTPEGMVVACGSIVIMALLAIFFAAYRSLNRHKENVRHLSSAASLERSVFMNKKMTKKDAAILPFTASFVLVGTYVVFKLFSKESINLLFTGLSFFFGVLALTHLLSAVVRKLAPAAIPNIPLHITFKQGEGETTQNLINYRFSFYDGFSFASCFLVGAWYLIQKHWIANNLFGLAFAVKAIELVPLNNVITGCILLCGFFFHDIFWVFGTDVMVTVAESFEVPNKLVFPRDLLQNGFAANNFALLGLGDVVVPGMFIALLLRFDHSLKRQTKTYFHAACLAYFLALIATIFVMYVFKHPQPALLYLVPACVGIPLLFALVKGDLTALLKYEDSPEEVEEKKKDESKPETKKIQ